SSIKTAKCVSTPRTPTALAGNKASAWLACRGSFTPARRQVRRHECEGMHCGLRRNRKYFCRPSGAAGGRGGSRLRRFQRSRSRRQGTRIEDQRRSGLHRAPACDFRRLADSSMRFWDCRDKKHAHEQTKHIFSATSAVCSVQNGVGNEEILAGHVNYVIRGTTFPAGHLIEPGHVGFDINGDTWIGPFEPTNTPYEFVERLSVLLNRSGMRVIPLKDARGAQWTKLIFNASTNPVGALTLLDHRAATRLAQTGALFNDLIAEGEAVAKALGIQLHGDPRVLVE